VNRRVRQLGALAGSAAVLVTAACGSQAAHPVVYPELPAPVGSPTLRALTDERPASIDVVSSSTLAHPGSSQAAALRSALAQEPPGSKVLGLTLARVKGFGFGADMTTFRLAWLVAMDPYGGAYGAGGPACGRLTFVVEFIDPGTGRWLMTTSGRQAGMTPLPALGPTPSPVQPSPSCGPAIPRVIQGTPAAN
jgi:hypothetical protein